MLNIRSVFVVVLFVLGTFFHFKFGFENAWYFYLTAIFLVLTQLFLGNVWQAFAALKKGDTERVGKIINGIAFPKLLIKRNRAYYYFVKGMLHLQQKDLAAAKSNLLAANQLGLFRANDQALCLLNLAHIHYVENDFAQSKKYMEQAKLTPSNDLMIKEHLQKLEKSLKVD